LPQEVFAAFSRIARATPGDDDMAALALVAREAATLSGADLVVLRLPDGPAEFMDVRHPAQASWPTARLLQRWYAEILQRKRPVELAARDRPHRLPLRHGAILPVLTGSGALGALGLFGETPAAVDSEQYMAALLAVQAGVARVEQARIRRHTETVTTTEVRDRVAREIHDGPLQLLSGIMLHLRLVRAGARQRSGKTLIGLESELEQAIRQMRALIRNLRVAHPDATLEERVGEALARLERTRGLTCTLRWRAQDSLVDETTADEVFQVINEALANVYRHSSAKHVEVHARARDGALEVTVRDDGVGFDVARALRTDARKLSFGLMTMQERVTRLGGTLVLRSQAGRGTRVLITVPVRQLEERKGA
jgi:signal transduction histidine kinase